MNRRTTFLFFYNNRKWIWNASSTEPPLWTVYIFVIKQSKKKLISKIMLLRWIINMLPHFSTKKDDNFYNELAENDLFCIFPYLILYICLIMANIWNNIQNNNRPSTPTSFSYKSDDTFFHTMQPLMKADRRNRRRKLFNKKVSKKGK